MSKIPVLLDGHEHAYYYAQGLSILRILETATLSSSISICAALEESRMREKLCERIFFYSILNY